MATHGKLARELAQHERRERKRAKTAEVAALGAAGNTPAADRRDAHAESAEAIR